MEFAFFTFTGENEIDLVSGRIIDADGEKVEMLTEDGFHIVDGAALIPVVDLEIIQE